MECPEYLERASEFLDGRLVGDASREMEAHLSECHRCRQYHHTLKKGRDLLRSIPHPDLSPDFQERLHHRLFHIEDGSSIARESLGSGATTASVLAMAVLLAVAAWAPSVGVPQVSVELPAVVVGPPAPGNFTSRPQTPTFTRGLSLFSAEEFQEGVWGDTHRILFEYSSLSERRRGSYLSRVGLQ